MFPFDYFKKRKSAKAKVDLEAKLLVLLLKDKALAMATENLIKAAPNEKAHYGKVRQSVRKRLGIAPHIDTATRYL